MISFNDSNLIMCTCRNTKCICQTPHLISLKCIPNEHEAIPREFNLHKLNEMSKEVRLPAHRLVSELSHSIELFLHLAAFSALTPMAKTGRHSSLTNSHAICVGYRYLRESTSSENPLHFKQTFLAGNAKRLGARFHNILCPWAATPFLWDAGPISSLRSG